MTRMPTSYLNEKFNRMINGALEADKDQLSPPSPHTIEAFRAFYFCGASESLRLAMSAPGDVESTEKIISAMIQEIGDTTYLSKMAYNPRVMH